MHKLFLTKTECEVINGSQEIVEAFGGFPSMENTEIVDASISRKGGLLDVSFLFDTHRWVEISASYKYDVKQPEKRKVRIEFKGVREATLVAPADYWICTGLKFDSASDRKKWYQDEYPSAVSEIPRPFCCLYSFSRNIVLEFREDECVINATIAE